MLEKSHTGMRRFFQLGPAAIANKPERERVAGSKMSHQAKPPHTLPTMMPSTRCPAGGTAARATSPAHTGSLVRQRSPARDQLAPRNGDAPQPSQPPALPDNARPHIARAFQPGSLREREPRSPAPGTFPPVLRCADSGRETHSTRDFPHARRPPTRLRQHPSRNGAGAADGRAPGRGRCPPTLPTDGGRRR